LQTGQPLLRRVLLWGARYLVPRPDGRVLVGSTEEDAGFAKRTTAAAVSGLLALAGRLVPALAEAHLEQCWAGLRPGSPDGLPFLGPVPGCDNLFVAAGHFRAGIQLSPATGLVMKELLLGQPLTVSLEPFRLDRTPGPASGRAFPS
jgi:glycine oxidase